MAKRKPTSISMEIRVVFVCLGNICRSPLAEAVMNKKVEEAGLENILSSDSAGTGSWHIGERPDPRTVDCIAKNNLTIDHRAQQFDRSFFDRYDYLIAMDRSNLRDMSSLAVGNESEKLLLMRDFDLQDKGADVPDPYYGGEGGFQEVHDILDRTMDKLLDYIRQSHPNLNR